MLQQVHYDNTEEAAAAALLSFPMPKSFVKGVQKTDQMELF